SLHGDAAVNAHILRRLNGPIQELDEHNLNSAGHALRHAHVVVDAIFGTGLTRPAQGLYAKAIELLNQADKWIAAVDVPSGIGSDSGQVSGPHVTAQLTAALAQYKRCHWLFPAAAAMGALELVDIGLTPGALEGVPDVVGLIEETDVRALFPPRQTDTHKGSYGHLLVLAGSRGKGGAAGLTALAGLRSGAGLATLACPEGLVPALEFQPLEVMTLPLPQTPDGELAADGVQPILNNLSGKSALAVGPGLGTTDTTVELLKNLLPQVTLPLVVDADGLNGLAKAPGLLQHLPAATILTPHPKEMARMCGLSTGEILDNKLETAQQFAQKYSVVLVLKGAHSIIALPDGRARINPTGNPGMATGGSGDVLTGLIGGLLAQGLTAPEAAVAGVYLHGLAGDECARAASETTLIAGDLLRTLPQALKTLLP
ncbi:MAG: NAD(P)H-hydrate dehydratase, partial [Nitrospinaceae bacterium]